MLTFFWHISYMIWYLLSLCMQTNKQTYYAHLFSHSYHVHVIHMSFSYHMHIIQTMYNYLRYWWHLGSNHVTCWPFSTRNRRATINTCKNTNLTPARAPQDMLTYVYLCPYLGFWPTSNHPRNCESQSNPPARFFFPGFAPLFMRIPQHRNVPIWVLDFNPPG